MSVGLPNGATHTAMELKVDDAFWVYLNAIVVVWKRKRTDPETGRTYLTFYEWISERGIDAWASERRATPKKT